MIFQLSKVWLAISARLTLGLASDSFATVAVVIAGYSLVELLSGPDYLLSLAWAIIHARHGQMSHADAYVFAQLAGSLFAIAGTAMIAYILARFSEPPHKHVPDDGAEPHS